MSADADDDIFDREQFDRLILCLIDATSPEEMESATEWLWDVWKRDRLNMVEEARSDAIVQDAIIDGEGSDARG